MRESRGSSLHWQPVRSRYNTALTIHAVDRNYGGMWSALRWVFWLAPLWIVTMPLAADATSRSRTWRIVLAVLLGLSALSAAYPHNPWARERAAINLRACR